MSLLSIIDFANELVKQAADKLNTISDATALPPPDTTNQAITPDAMCSVASASGEVSNISKLGLMELASYEGLANYPYLDSVGVKTYGIGLTSTDTSNLAKMPWTQFTSDADCVKLFASKVQHYVDAVNSELKVGLKQHEFDALVSITYNIGTGNTVTNKGGMAGSTFIDLINKKAAPAAIVAAMKMWNKGTVGGKRVVIKGLVNRRQKEADLYLSGKYLSQGKVARIIVNQSSHKPSYSGYVNIEPYL